MTSTIRAVVLGVLPRGPFLTRRPRLGRGAGGALRTTDGRAAR